MISLARWCTALVIATQLLYLLGPVADHHFIERLPGHAHIYPSSAPLQHLHPLQTAHTHTAVMPSPPGASLPLEGNGLIYLPSDGDGSTLTHCGLTMGLLVASVVLVFAAHMQRVPQQQPRPYAGPFSFLGPPPPRLAL